MSAGADPFRATKCGMCSQKTNKCYKLQFVFDKVILLWYGLLDRGKRVCNCSGPCVMRKGRLNAGVKPPGEPLKNPFRQGRCCRDHKRAKKALKMGDEMQVDVLPDTLEVYINRIDSAVDEFCMRYNISSLKDESQNVFSACMYFIYRQVFKPSSTTRYNTKSVLDYNDIDLLADLCTWYIFFCQINNKIPCLGDYCKCFGISDELIRLWKIEHSENGDKVTLKKFGIFKRLFDEKEHALENTLLSAKGNASIGVLAILNHRYGWNMPHVSREEVKPRLTRNELLQGLDALPEKPIGIDSGDT